MGEAAERIRGYRAGDEESILGLLREVFEEDRSLERWRWQFRAHPRGPGWVTVTESGGRIVGHHGLMRQHLNFLGREVPAAQECDAMVRAELRGRQVYTRMAAHQYERGQGDGLQAVVAYPSRNSFPGSYPMLIRRLDYVRIANLRYYTRRIGLARIWGRPIDRFGKLLAGVPRRMTSALAMLSEGRGIEIETTGKTPSDLEEALRQIREYEVLAFWKDAPYLKWRYEDHPDHRYAFHVLRVRGAAEGLVVTRDTDRRIAVCELLHRRKDVRRAALLLRHVVEHYGSTGAQRVDFYGHDNGFFEAAFRSAGFRAEAFSRIIFTGRALSDPKLAGAFPYPHHWTIAYGDLDGI